MVPERQPEAGYAYERRVAQEYDADEVRELGRRSGEGANKPQRVLIQSGHAVEGEADNGR